MPGIISWFKEFMREYERGTALMRGRPVYPTVVDERTPTERITSGVEVLDGGDEAVISVNLPNVRPEDIDVTLSRREVLTVSGLVRDAKTSGSGDPFSDLGVGLDGFREVVPLPPGFDNGATGASFEDGVLKVTFSRTESEEEEGRRVPLRDANN